MPALELQTCSSGLAGRGRGLNFMRRYMSAMIVTATKDDIIAIIG
jgi:hypothetical protein